LKTLSRNRLGDVPAEGIALSDDEDAWRNIMRPHKQDGINLEAPKRAPLRTYNPEEMLKNILNSTTFVDKRIPSRKPKTPHRGAVPGVITSPNAGSCIKHESGDQQPLVTVAPGMDTLVELPIPPPHVTTSAGQLVEVPPPSSSLKGGILVNNLPTSALTSTELERLVPDSPPKQHSHRSHDRDSSSA
jgi:hypothetical protein